MKSQSSVYSKNKPSFTINTVNYGFTRYMGKSFGEQLREKLNEAGLTAAELSRRSGVTKQNIGRILNNTPHSITGASPKVEPDTVEKLAKPLNWNLDSALLAAGHAPRRDDGLFSGLERLSPENQKLAKRQIKIIIDSLAQEEDPDTDYI